MDIDTDKLKQLLEEMTKNAGPNTIIMADPEIVEQLIREGSPLIQMVPRKPAREELIESFEKRKNAALEIIDKIPAKLDVSRPSIQQLYDEIVDCILFGVNGAAITLCGILVEYVLKYVTYHWDIPERSVAFDSTKWDQIVESTQLCDAINQAKTLCIINEEESVNLLKFKDEVRNPYSHYNIRKLIKNIGAPIPRIDMIKETVETVEMILDKDPAFFPLAKKWRDEKFLVSIFVQTYRNARILLSRLDARRNTKNQN